MKFFMGCPLLLRMGLASDCSRSGSPGTGMASASAAACGPDSPHTNTMPCITCETCTESSQLPPWKWFMSWEHFLFCPLAQQQGPMWL